MSDKFDSFELCAYCGEVFETDLWYPVVTDVIDGELKIFSFCDDGCLSAWQGETATGDD